MVAVANAPRQKSAAVVETFEPVLFNNVRYRHISYVMPGTGRTGVVDPLTRRPVIDERLRERIQFTNGIGYAKTPEQLERLRQDDAKADGTYEAMPGFAEHCETCQTLWNHPKALAECVNSHGANRELY